MPLNPDEHYLIAKNSKQVERANLVAGLVNRYRYLEDLLLLLSIPVLVGSILLWAIGSAIGGTVPLIAFILGLVVTLITLMMACILFFKWIDVLQARVRKFARTMDDETALKLLGVSAVCIILLILIILTAEAGGGEQQVILQFLIFILLGWHYRSLIQIAKKKASLERKHMPSP